MKCVRTPMEATVYKYELGKGLEDGFHSYSKVITNGFVDVENLVVTEDNQCPYVRNRRGCTFIKNGDYVICDADGTKHVVGDDKFLNRYEIIEE